MTTVAVGADVALVFTFPGGNIIGAGITIEPAAGGAAVVGPTSAGIGAAGDGRYTYVWSVPVDTIPGLYTATITGTDGGTVTESVTIAVTGLPVYASLADLKEYRGVDTSTDDALFLKRLTVASRAIDKRTDRRFYLDATATTRTYRARGRVRCDRDGDLLMVDDIGSMTDLSADFTDFDTAPDNALVKGQAITGLFRVGGWRAERVGVTARWGWPSVPDDIREATVLLANRLILRKDSPEGIAASGEWGAIRVSRWDPDVDALVAPFLLPGIG